MTRQATIAVEWLHASGERTEARLHKLVEHWCNVGAIHDPESRDAVYREALNKARAERGALEDEPCR